MFPSILFTLWDNSLLHYWKFNVGSNLYTGIDNIDDDLKSYPSIDTFISITYVTVFLSNLFSLVSSGSFSLMLLFMPAYSSASFTMFFYTHSFILFDAIFVWILFIVVFYLHFHFHFYIHNPLLPANNWYLRTLLTVFKLESCDFIFCCHVIHGFNNQFFDW